MYAIRFTLFSQNFGDMSKYRMLLVVLKIFLFLYEGVCLPFHVAILPGI